MNQQMEFLKAAAYHVWMGVKGQYDGGQREIPPAYSSDSLAHWPPYTSSCWHRPDLRATSTQTQAFPRLNAYVSSSFNKRRAQEGRACLISILMQLLLTTQGTFQKKQAMCSQGRGHPNYNARTSKEGTAHCSPIHPSSENSRLFTSWETEISGLAYLFSQWLLQ